MKKFYITILLILFSFQISFSQIKEIKGDTVFWYKDQIELLEKLNLKNFEKSSDEFNFRFRNLGQIIEISKDSSAYSGIIANYIYHRRWNGSKSKTLSNKIILSSEQAENIYNIIQESKILSLPTDKEIENWAQGLDGMAYIIEHSDRNTYWFKNYWSPSAKAYIPEAIIVLDLIKKLSDTLKLSEAYSSFKSELPKTGCYSSGGMSQMCYSNNSWNLGYSGATKLPLGFYSSYFVNYIGKTKINAGVALQYNFNANGFQHLNFQLAKWPIFFEKTNLSDFIGYNYQNRLLNINSEKRRFENHQIKYGLNTKSNIGIGAGIDYLARTFNQIGAHLFADKWFPKPKISTSFSTSIFNEQINYKTEIFKTINSLPVRRLDIGLTYESFMKYRDLYFSVRVSL